MKNKILLLGAALLVTQSLSAETTICYKKDWAQPSTIEDTALDGGECKGESSLNTMRKNGWFIKDIDIKSSKEGMNYTYILSDVNPIKIEKQQNTSTDNRKNLALLNQPFTLSNITNDSAIINIGNLTLGQSGIIRHKYNDGQEMIVSSAYVSKTNANTSTLTFIPFLDLKQNAIPTSNRKVIQGDIFILNYLYDTSLLITPNIDSFRGIRNKFVQNNFLHTDIFAAYLKSEHRPLPSKALIQQFAMSQNLGTIYFVINSMVYIVDTKTFTILDKQITSNISRKSQMPFYTRIENIESSLLTEDISEWFNFDFINEYLGDNKTEEEILYGDLAEKKAADGTDYNAYYKQLLGV